MAGSLKRSRNILSRLCAILDADACAAGGVDPIQTLRAFLAGGASLLQLRAKRLPSGAFLELATEAVALAHAANARLIVNDRADLAALSSADGVHVGQDDLAPAAVRPLVRDRIVGLSTHTIDQLARALDAPIDYVAIGPIFATSTKATGYDPIGLAMVGQAAAIAARRGLPLVAIGGITLDHAPAVIDAGAASVAVIGDLLAGGDPERRVRDYLRTLG